MKNETKGNEKKREDFELVVNMIVMAGIINKDNSGRGVIGDVSGIVGDTSPISGDVKNTL